MPEDRQAATSTDDSTPVEPTTTDDTTQTPPEGGEPTPSPAPTPTPQPTPAPSPTPQPSQDDDEDDDDDDLDDDLDRPITRGEARKIRREIAKYRTERNQEREARKAAEAQNHALRQRQALDGAAREKGIDPDLLFGYLTTQGKVADLDPNNADAVASLVEEAVAAKPSLVTTQTPAPRRSGGEFNGDNPPGPDPASMDMDAYMKWRESRDSTDE